MKAITHSARRSCTALGAAAALLAAPSAFAASTWNLSSGCIEKTANAGGFGNTFGCSAGSGSPTLTTTAWSTTGAGSTFATANLALYPGYGFGVRNQAEGLAAGIPGHSMDNAGTTDMLALNFSSGVALNKVTLGWSYNDSDISLLRYTGTTAPVLAGKSVTSLLTSGWELIGNYADLVVGAATNVNNAAKSSSWWLVSAYNAGFGGSVFDNAPDYVKVLTVAATAATGTTISSTTPVPEPGTLALVALATAAAGLARRQVRAGR